MTAILNIFILLLELSGLILLVRRLGILHILVLFYGIALVYAQAYLIDYLVFLRPAELKPIYGLNLEIDIFSITYLKLQGVQFLFFLSYFIIAISSREQLAGIEIPNSNITRHQDLILYIFMAFCSVWTIYFIVSQLGLTRFEKGSLLTPSKLIINNVVAYSWLLITLNIRQKGLSYYLYTLVIISGFILSFEREPLLVVFIALLFCYGKRINFWGLALSSIFCVLILAYWKPLYFAFFYSDGLGLAQIAWHFDKFGFSLAAMDPVGSNVLLYDFIENGNIYIQHRLSYVHNFYMQFYRMLFPSDYQTLAEYASEYYVDGKFGLAFSMILESLINLSYAGPIFLGIAISSGFRFLYKYSKIYGPGIAVAALVIAIKFIRTELATLVKLQVFPLLISFIVVVILIQKFKIAQSAKNTEHLHSNLQPG